LAQLIQQKQKQLSSAWLFFHHFLGLN
jgi:hypothetical protein